MTTKILVVDDEPNLEPLICQIFKQKIQQKEMCFIFAENGVEALAKLNQEIDLVLTDINMPKMDGLTLLTKIQFRKAILNPALTTIIISAYDDMQNIRKAMNLGAFDFLTKPIEAADLRRTIAKTIEHIQLLKKAQAQQQLVEEKLRRINEELEQRVEARTAELLQSNAELDAFAHTVAHGLKTPLSLIVSYVGLFDEYDATLDPELIPIIHTIQEMAYKSINIIEALLLLASVRQSDVILQPLDMDHIINQVCKGLQSMIEEYQGEVILPEQWPTALGYAPWLEEVWTNYISNGLKYGGTPPRLELGSTVQEGGMIRFWVRDNGPGLSPADQNALFTEFSRLDERDVEGHGLGLSIVRRIIEKMGGEVGVKSSNIPGQGSEFYFTLRSAKKFQPMEEEASVERSTAS